MTSPTFFDRARSLTVREIATLTGAEPRGGADARSPHHRRRGARPRAAGRPDVSRQAQICRAAPASQAGACLTTRTVRRRGAGSRRRAVRARALSGLCRGRADAVRRRAAAVVAVRRRAASQPARSFIQTARLESGVTVDPAAVIGPRAEIGTGTVIHAGAVIGPKVRIGRDCAIGAHVSIMHTPDRRPRHRASRHAGSARTASAT